MEHLKGSTHITPAIDTEQAFIDQLINKIDPGAFLSSMSPSELEQFEPDGLVNHAVEIVENFGETKSTGGQIFSAGGAYSIDLNHYPDSTSSLLVTRNEDVILQAQKSEGEWSVEFSKADRDDAAHFSITSDLLSTFTRDFVAKPDKQSQKAEQIASQFLHESELQSLFKESSGLQPRSMRIGDQPPVRVYFFNIDDEPRVHFFETNKEGSEVIRSANFDISKNGELSLHNTDDREKSTSFLLDINKQGYADILYENFVDPWKQELTSQAAHRLEKADRGLEMGGKHADELGQETSKNRLHRTANALAGVLNEHDTIELQTRKGSTISFDVDTNTLSLTDAQETTKFQATMTADGTWEIDSSLSTVEVNTILRVEPELANQIESNRPEKDTQTEL